MKPRARKQAVAEARRRDVVGVSVSPAALVCAVCGSPLRVVDTSMSGRFWFIEVACRADESHAQDRGEQH